MQSGLVTGREIKKNKDGKKTVILLQCQITDPDDVQSVELMNHTGEDNNPPNNSRVTIVDIGQAFKIAVSSDDNIEPVTSPGEKRIYSTDEDNSVVKSSIYLKNDGTIIADNGSVTITADHSGKLTIVTSGNTEISSAKTIINNDVLINGELEVTDLITAPDLSGGGISFINHVHEQNNDSGGDIEQDTEIPKEGP